MQKLYKFFITLNHNKTKLKTKIEAIKAIIVFMTKDKHAESVSLSFFFSFKADMPGGYTKIKTSIASALDFVKFCKIASFKFDSSAPYTIDIVLIIASFDSNPVISDTADFQFANPEKVNIGAIRLPSFASKLCELSSTNFKF